MVMGEVVHGTLHPSAPHIEQAMINAPSQAQFHLNPPVNMPLYIMNVSSGRVLGESVKKNEYGCRNVMTTTWEKQVDWKNDKWLWVFELSCGHAFQQPQYRIKNLASGRFLGGLYQIPPGDNQRGMCVTHDMTMSTDMTKWTLLNQNNKTFQCCNVGMNSLLITELDEVFNTLGDRCVALVSTATYNASWCWCLADNRGV